ncbi:MAG: hypothetical protein GXP52_10590 [Deltaproteobacteria bacterium]|nr:hypothetical protein [Deltaproteobacteria bacterium]
MKWKVVMIAVLSLVVVGGGYGLARAQSGRYNNPMASGHMMGNYSNDEHTCWSNSDETASVQVTKEEAGNIVAYQLRRSNPRLKVGKVQKAEGGFEVLVVTKKGEVLVDRLLVNKNTGNIYRMQE